LKIVFVGMNEGGTACAGALVRAGIAPSLILTRRDYPVDTGNSLADFAAEAGIPIIKPENVNDESVVSGVLESAPDLLLTAFFNQKLGPGLLDAGRLGSVNFHPSLLPRYRGATPVHWAIVNGERRTGVTAHFMGTSFDTGGIILQRSLRIGPDETAGELFTRLIGLAAEMIVEVVRKFERGAVVPVAQDEAQATQFPKRRREHARIDWSGSAREIHNLIRGMNPDTLAWSVIAGAEIDFVKSRVTRAGNRGAAPGTILRMSPEGMLVAAGGSAAILITEYSPHDKNAFASLEAGMMCC
jgi:methionyl-tRNA formyltransferase